MAVLRIPNKEDRHWSYRYRCEKCGQEHVSSCELPEHMLDHTVTSDIRSGLCRGKVVLVAKERDQ